MNQLLTEQLAYFAGLFDGEGSCSVVLHKNPVRYYALVQLTMLDNDVVRDMADGLGGRINYHHAASGRKTVRAVWNGAAASAMLRLILPYLRIKAPQARLVLAFSDRRLELSEAEKEGYRQQLITLNQGKCHLVPANSVQAV